MPDQPKHDHNLRDPAGDSPLMQASLLGRLDVLKFLLESSSYSIFSNTNAR